MAQTYLIKSSPTAGNRTKGTISVWLKRSSLGTYQNIYVDFYSTDNFAGVRLNSNDTLGVFSYSGGSAQLDINTTRVFRDTNSWYHLCVAWDTTDGTASDRIKIYVNGERETSFSGSPTYPTSSQQIMFGIGGTYPIVIGRRGTDNAEYFDGLMSHFHRVDNQALAPTVFGSTDSTTGEWKISTSPSITYTGSSDYNFFILKDGNSLTDQSGQSNDLTLGYGTLTKTEDCPSNVFGTFNPLHIQSGRALTMSNGNGKIASNQNNWQPIGCTLAVPPKTGKWYWEFSQFIEAQTFVGLISSECNININLPYQATDGMITYFYAGRLTNDGSETENYFTAISTTTDVVGVALDMTAGTHGQVQFYLNGSPTGSAVALGSSFANQFVMPFAMCNGTGGRSVSINTGNGYFGTTAVSSAGTNASGIGIFEHDVPANHTALSTKGLNE